ncbi:MAG: AGE family epimerase/isomerase [Nocardioides sp.]
MHQAYLHEQAARLWRFYIYRSVDPRGGFFDLDDHGEPRDIRSRSLVATTRMIHCFSIAHAAGLPGALTMVAHGLKHLGQLWDSDHGGWVWARGADGSTDARKLNYGHAFAILAGASATDAGIVGGQQLLEQALEIHDRRFWDETHGIAVDEYLPDWSVCLPYRGQNGNMHLTEAYLAVAALQGGSEYLERANAIAERLIRTHAQAADRRVPEHYSSSWVPDLDYGRHGEFDVWKPYGATTGHGLEWSRLLMQLWDLGGRQAGWMPLAARGLFDRALADGWDAERGGIAFTTDWSGTVANADRYHWVHAEAVAAAAAFLSVPEHDDGVEGRYRELWGFIDEFLIDHERGGWFHQLDPDNRVKTDPWFGKPDIYHALTACLLPMTDPLSPLPSRAVRRRDGVTR